MLNNIPKLRRLLLKKEKNNLLENLLKIEEINVKCKFLISKCTFSVIVDIIFEQINIYINIIKDDP